jgi:hypothetical protein
MSLDFGASKVGNFKSCGNLVMRGYGVGYSVELCGNRTWNMANLKPDRFTSYPHRGQISVPDIDTLD